MLTREQMDSLTRFHDDLLYWNARVNLISRKDEEQIWVRHILHSLLLLKYVEFKPKARVLDVGTGGGLPGLPIKIARPDVKLTLVDSVAKKMKMVSMFAQHTGLKDIEVKTSRVETLADDRHYHRYFDVIISRGVASAKNVIEWTRPLLNPKGCWAFLKGGDLTEERNELKPESTTGNGTNGEKPGRIVIEEVLIDCFGVPQFKQDEKKVLICQLS